jgi:hypothetical protein
MAKLVPPEFVVTLKEFAILVPIDMHLNHLNRLSFPSASSSQ